MDTNMPTRPQFPIKVFYDGSCSVCSAEIEHYLRQEHGGRLQAVDISAPGFNPEPHGITQADFMYELHVIDQAGVVYRGVVAFWAIWQAFPAVPLYRVLGGVINIPLVNPVARLLYKAFARIRPYLSKRRGCDDGTCKTGRK